MTCVGVQVYGLRARHAQLLTMAAVRESDCDRHREILVSFFDDLADDGEEPLADLEVIMSYGPFVCKSCMMAVCRR